MKLAYVLPGTVADAPGGPEKMAGRLQVLRTMTFADTEIDIFDIPHGPQSIESLYEEYLAIPGTVIKMLELEKLGYDAAVLGCFGDPGLDAVREVTTRMAVVGPGEASILLAAMCGHRFSIITATTSLINVMEQLVHKYCLDIKLASVRAVGIPVLDLQKDLDLTVASLITQARLAIETDRADTLMLGCMSLGFLNVSDLIAEKTGIPVINPVRASVSVAQSLAAQGLLHSKLAYPCPPKMAP